MLGARFKIRKPIKRNWQSRRNISNLSGLYWSLDVVLAALLLLMPLMSSSCLRLIYLTRC